MPFNFTNFQFRIAGSGSAPVPTISASCQSRDRRSTQQGLTQSVLISLSPTFLSTVPPDFQGFTVERSSDGVTFSDISGLVIDSPFYVDRPGAGIFWYQATTTTAMGTVSAASSAVQVQVADLGAIENGSVNDIEVAGTLRDSAGAGLVAPDGLGSACAGTGIAEGSFAGSWGAGSFFLESSEIEPPISTNEVPVCGSVDISLPVAAITYTLEDQPNPGGSGIDEPTIQIWLQVTSKDNNSNRLIWDGASDQWAAEVTTSIVNGADPLLQRDITITFIDTSYVGSLDTVIITTYVKDLAGNEATLTCSWIAEELDTTAPVVSQQDPVCGIGTTTGDLTRAPRDTTYSFRVTDDVAVDVTTLQVYHGLTSSGPWTQVLQNGATFLSSYTGSVTAISGEPVIGYDVSIRRPVADPLWPADAVIYMRITVDDSSGNSTEDICSFKTEALAFIRSVYVIGQRLILVEFSMPMQLTENFLLHENFTLTPEGTASNVGVRELMPQKFFVRSDEQNEQNYRGSTETKFLFIRSSEYTTFGRYVLSVQNLLDRHGVAMANDGQSFTFRARRTKFDTATQDVRNLGLGEGEIQLGDDTAVDGNILIAALTYNSDQIGGTFVLDDWEDLD